MLSARQNVIARCARSRQTPFRCSSTSTAVVSGLLVPYWNAMLSWTQSQIACTLAPPGSVAPNSSHAIPISWSERRSEEHTSELQSRGHLVCRLLLEKKKIHV